MSRRRLCKSCQAREDRAAADAYARLVLQGYFRPRNDELASKILMPGLPALLASLSKEGARHDP
jgi:hypothetical protein